MTTLKLTNYKVLSTGADGGHYYISTEIEYNGVKRQIPVLFKSKSDEKRLSDKSEILLEEIYLTKECNNP